MTALSRVDIAIPTARRGGSHSLSAAVGGPRPAAIDSGIRSPTPIWTN